MLLLPLLLESSTCKIVSNAMFVLPAPVGAQTNKFSGVLKAASNNFD